MNTFAETESLLRLSIALSQNSVKDIAAASGIKASTLYKWRTNEKVHLSPTKADTLLHYFYEKEPKTIVAAIILNLVLIKLEDYLTSSTEEDVREVGMNHANL